MKWREELRRRSKKRKRDDIIIIFLFRKSLSKIERERERIEEEFFNKLKFFSFKVPRSLTKPQNVTNNQQ